MPPKQYSNVRYGKFTPTPRCPLLAPQGLQYELARHYYDIVSITAPAPILAVKNFLPTTQLLFGSYFPYAPIAPQLKGIGAFEFANDDRVLVSGGNAQRLLKL
jgi:6-methylsalicylate decarboxylase